MSADIHERHRSRVGQDGGVKECGQLTSSGLVEYEDRVVKRNRQRKIRIDRTDQAMRVRITLVAFKEESMSAPAPQVQG